MVKIKGQITAGYGVASGKGADWRYPAGTLSIQAPFFRELGLDLTNYFQGTLNVNIAPYSYELKNSKHYFKNVHWSPHLPPENFYFFDVTVFFKEVSYVGLIYMPDPKTKVDHQHSNTVIELILPVIEDIKYGDKISLELEKESLSLSKE